MASDPVLRRAAASDLEDVMAVLETANFHHIPSEEMPEFDLSQCFVAEIDGRIVGVAGYTRIDEGRGKTTLMAVHPSARGQGIGLLLQGKRMSELKSLGCKSVVTNADRPEVVSWYEKHFGYRKIGSLQKQHEFGDPTIDHWTTMEADLSNWEQ